MQHTPGGHIKWVESDRFVLASRREDPRNEEGPGRHQQTL